MGLLPHACVSRVLARRSFAITSQFVEPPNDRMRGGTVAPVSVIVGLGRPISSSSVGKSVQLTWPELPAAPS